MNYALIWIVAFIVGSVIGSTIMQNKISQDCNLAGVTRIDNSVYDCKIR